VLGVFCEIGVYFEGIWVEGKFLHVMCFIWYLRWIYDCMCKNIMKIVMEWMVDIQLGRRNLSFIQRIAVKLVEIKKTVMANSSQVISNNKDRNPYNRFDN
jgi:hypothetical protein